jgi:hypothetical protein
MPAKALHEGARRRDCIRSQQWLQPGGQLVSSDFAQIVHVVKYALRPQRVHPAR